MKVEVAMPQLGETVAEGTIIRWLRHVGDVVSDQEPLLEISTDKVDTEVPAPSSGTLLEIRVPEDETVSVGTILAVIGAPSPGTCGPLTPTLAVVPETTVAGPGSESNALRHRAPRHAHSPRVRRLAAEYGLSLVNLRGSGPRGRVTPNDVASAAAADDGGRDRSPAAHLTSQPTAVAEVDVTTVLELLGGVDRSAHQRGEGPLTLTSFVAKAALDALTRFPSLSSSAAEDEPSVQRRAVQHLAVAIHTDGGSVAGVLRNASDLSLMGVSRRIRELATEASRGAAKPDVLTSATFTIIDAGNRGVLFHTPILGPGQAGVLGIGAAVERPAIVHLADGERAIAIRSTVHLALTYDHRGVEDGVASRFLTTIKDRLESARFEPELA